MDFIETASLRGEVLITASDGTNTEVLVDDRNLIVLNGRMNAAKNMINAGSVYITDVKFGSNGTATGSSTDVKPVLPEEVTFSNAISVVKNTDYSFACSEDSLDGVARPKLVFTINVPKGSTDVGLNGKSINEIALMLNDNTIFALKRFATITKSTSVSFNITWTIFF